MSGVVRVYAVLDVELAEGVDAFRRNKSQVPDDFIHLITDTHNNIPVNQGRDAVRTRTRVRATRAASPPDP